MENETRKKINIKRSVIIAVVLVLSWQLGVYSGIGALLGGGGSRSNEPRYSPDQRAIGCGVYMSCDVGKR